MRAVIATSRVHINLIMDLLWACCEGSIADWYCFARLIPYPISLGSGNRWRSLCPRVKAFWKKDLASVSVLQRGVSSPVTAMASL